MNEFESQTCILLLGLKAWRESQQHLSHCFSTGFGILSRSFFKCDQNRIGWKEIHTLKINWNMKWNCSKISFRSANFYATKFVQKFDQILPLLHNKISRIAKFSIFCAMKFREEIAQRNTTKIRRQRDYFCRNM